MAPSRRKTVVISDDEDDQFELDDILSDDEKSAGKYNTVVAKSPKRAKRAKAPNKSPTTTNSTKSSAKSSPQKTPKSKTTAAGQENGTTKGTLLSFFNATTQRQQSALQTPPIASPTLAKIDSVEEEGIDDSEAFTILNGSKTALAARKRKQNDVAHLFDPAVYNAAAGSQKFRKTSVGTKLLAQKDVDRRPWTEQFGPLDLSELAVHNKKVADVRRLLEESLFARGRPRLIVLQGPAGAGKTTTVRLLAKDIGLSVREWKNPTDVDFRSGNNTSTSAQFEDFIFRGGNFAGLELVADGEAAPKRPAPSEVAPAESSRNIIMIEEFPISLSPSSSILQAFRSTLLAYLSTPHTPSRPAAPVFIVMSETFLSSSNFSESMSPHRLLGPALLTHPLTATIEFNPMAPTLLTKALSLVAIKESRVTGRRRTPGLPVLSKLAEMGDVRSAVSALEFLCLRGDEGDSWSAKISFGKPKGRAGPKNGSKSTDEDMTEQEREALKIVGGRETALELWHGVGKVVYNKRVEQKSQAANGTRSVKVPENDPEQMFVELATDPATFVAAVHENFVLSCKTESSECTIAALDDCLSVLSDADELTFEHFYPGADYGTALEGLRQEEIAFHTAIRGVVFSLPRPVKRDSTAGAGGASRSKSNVMAWPQSLRLWRGQEEMDDLADLCLEEYRKVLRESHETDENTADGDWMRASASSKASMVLEQAPYMRLVHRGRGNVSALKHHISRIAQFSSLHGAVGGSVSRAAADDEWAEDDASKSPGRTRRTRTEKQDGIFGVEEDVKGLVLSEDDIEDE